MASYFKKWNLFACKTFSLLLKMVNYNLELLAPTFACASESNVLELKGLTVPGFEPVVIGGPLNEQVERFREILERFSGK